MRYSLPDTATDKAFYLFDVAFQWANRLLSTNPRKFIDIETVEDEYTVVMSDGTLLTAVSIEGASKTVLHNEFVEILNEGERRLTAYMADGCHYVSFFFLRDSDGAREEVERVYGGARAAIKNMGLALDDLVEEQIEVLSKICRKERCILLFWSNNKGLTRDEKNLAAQIRMKQRKGMPLANDAQDLGMGVDMMLTKHKSFVNEFCRDLSSVYISTRTLDVHEFLYELRSSIDSEWTPSSWEPFLPNDPIPMRLDNKYAPDCSGMVWPSMKEQLFPRGAEMVDHATVKIGDTVFSPMTIELMPRSPEPFQALFNRLEQEDIPWRYHMMIKPDGMSVMGFKELLASFMQYTPAAENKYLVEVKKNLQGLRDSGEEVVKLQISICTWGPADDLKEVERRRAILNRCVQGWGNCEVAPAEGDPLETMMSSTAGGVLNSIANPAAAPLYEAVKMAPLTRPSSPWQIGSQPLRSADGKIIPYQPYSKLQTSWTSLIFAPMGYGKSVFMNYSNISLVLSPDNTELPFISIIDVGPSSKGLIDLLAGALPKDKKHMVMYSRLLNSEEYAINVFDTRLGLRFPLSNQKAFLINFLSYLCTPDDGDSPPDGILGIADTVITLAYSVGADRKTAKNYSPRVAEAIDRILAEKGFKIEIGATKWWDIVDFLYKEGMSHEATLAQRFAVPTLEDIVHLVNDTRVESIYGDAKIGSTSETMPKYFWRKITENINKYPIISGVTQFDLGEARVVSLDLDEVAKGQGSDAKRRTGLMYMVAYYVLTNRFFTGQEHLSEMQGEVGIYNIDYRPYHAKFVDSIKQLPKRFCIDEKHRVSGLKMVEQQLVESIREGRKWKVEIMQSSQLPEDFEEEAIRLASNIFILGGGNSANCDKVTKQFNLSPTMDYLLRTQIKRPSSRGSTLLAILETDKGVFEQLVMSTQGPTFLWACNSSSDDAYVRNTLASKIGDMEARRMLVKYHPAGNLDDVIESKKRLMGLEQQKGSYGGNTSIDAFEDEDGTPQSILEEIIEELEARYQIELENKAS